MIDRAQENYKGVQGRCRCRARRAKAAVLSLNVWGVVVGK
jgi:hypothetical protein